MTHESMVALVALYSIVQPFAGAFACSPDPEYLALTVEQKVARENLVFIGHVAKVEGDTVTLAVDEILRGSIGPSVRVRQGKGPDCQISYTEGAKIFFAGPLIFGSTTQFVSKLPNELVEVVEKLRTGEPLDQR